MKRLIACALAAAMCAGLAGCGTEVSAEPPQEAKQFEAKEAVPGSAASDSADAGESDGSAVTAAVKGKLGLDTEEYLYFRCESEEDPLEKRWRLYWTSADGSSLEILAGDDGSILSYSVDDGGKKVKHWYGGPSDIPKFPAGSAASARKAGEAFIGKCLADNESLELGSEPAYTSLGSPYYKFSGRILLNGIPAGIECSVNVAAGSNEILAFDRTDWRGMVTDGVPDPNAPTSAKPAKRKLAGELDLAAEYVLPEGSSEAYLVYKPVDTDTYYVDAKTGELVNLSEAARKAKAPMTFESAPKEMNVAESAMDAGGSAGLTDVELAGIERFEDAMDREALDEAARAIGALGLDKYGLSGVRYSVTDLSEEDGKDGIDATLTYSREVDGSNWTRTVVLDARTGDLASVYSSMYAGSSDAAKALRTVSAGDAKAAAEAFLKGLVPGKAAKCRLDAETGSLDEYSYLKYSYAWHQEEAGYPFYGNRLHVGIDATDGSVCAWRDAFDEDVTFAPVDDIFSKEEALKAWAGTYDAVLQYVQVPFAVDVTASGFEGLAGTWVEYMYDLVPGYALYRADDLMGIRADTCEPEPYPWSDRSGYAYSDVKAGTELGDMVLELARYGIGLGGGAFKAGEPLTDAVLDEMLAGLHDRFGYDRFTDAGGSGEDRPDGKALDRGEAVLAIAKAAVPEEMLGWSNAYAAGYVDWDGVPDALKGAAAFAAATGMLDGSASFDAGAPVTRGDAAMMIYRMLDR